MCLLASASASPCMITTDARVTRELGRSPELVAFGRAFSIKVVTSASRQKAGSCTATRATARRASCYRVRRETRNEGPDDQATICFRRPHCTSAFVSRSPSASPRPSRPPSLQRRFFPVGLQGLSGGKNGFYGGRCAGAIEVLDALNSETTRFCPPEKTTNLQRVKVVVDYIEAHSEAKNADFNLVANEAMAKAWPCKK